MAVKYEEQYQRVKRWQARLEATERGREHTVDSDNYVDEIYAFFLNCYHLKDWIKNDAEVSEAIRDQVEDHISGNRSLRLCADLCNSLKHLVLTRPRSTENPAFGRKHYSLEPGEASSRIALEYTIDTDTGPIGAFELATKCVNAWDAFLFRTGLH